MMFLIFLFLVMSPDVLVNRKNELYDSNAKNITALTLCIIELILLSIKKVPTSPDISGIEQGNRHINSPAIPEQVNNTSSTNEYPL